MSFIEETVFTTCAKEKIWSAWANAYWKNKDYQIDKKNYVITSKGKGIKFKIVDIKENESFVIDWHAHFIKLNFFYKVSKQEQGSLILCRVKLKGFFSTFVFFMIRKKLRQYISSSLQNFVSKL